MTEQQNMEAVIRTKLENELSPFFLEIVNDSDKHRGHAGYAPNSHFRLKIGAPIFEKLSRVESHKLIYGILSHEMTEEIHALSIFILREDQDSESKGF